MKDQGRKSNLSGEEYLFPYCYAAEAAIDDGFQNVKPIIAEHIGAKSK